MDEQENRMGKRGNMAVRQDRRVKRTLEDAVPPRGDSPSILCYLVECGAKRAFLNSKRLVRCALHVESDIHPWMGLVLEWGKQFCKPSAFDFAIQPFL